MFLKQWWRRDKIPDQGFLMMVQLIKRFYWQWHFAKHNIFTGKVAWNSYLTHGLRHYCVIDQSATENKVIHTLIIDFFSHGLRSVKIEQELEKYYLSHGLYTIACGNNTFEKWTCFSLSHAQWYFQLWWYWYYDVTVK
jgi:hypothetical protein